PTAARSCPGAARIDEVIVDLSLHAGHALSAPADRSGSPDDAPVSTSDRTLSSRKNGLPSVRSVSAVISGWTDASSPNRPTSSSWAPAGRVERLPDRII